MIADLYKTMIETATQENIPSYIEFNYVIPKEASIAFWKDKSLDKEKAILMDEFDFKGDCYCKTLYGVTFSIKFEK